ncbi:hypothetical protein HXY33_07100 [Candidatus Bathyarchaeota archaeon]|nr:hypothetical protein [Candidatus Bathyarchaeota archaeon]
MKSNVDAVAEIPCFKCLFWEWKKDSHLYCNPNECEKMTEWLLKEAEKCQKKEVTLTVVSAWHMRTKH